MYHILSDYTRDLPEISTKGLEGSERSERSESPNSSESSERLEDSSQFSKKYVRVTERTERSARNDESVRRTQSIKIDASHRTIFIMKNIIHPNPKSLMMRVQLEICQ